MQIASILSTPAGLSVKSAAWFDDYIEDLDAGSIIKLQVRRGGSSGTNFDRLVFLQIPK